MTRSKFYVTTPIYYVNAQPHIGHAYTTILADVLARYHRLMGIPSFFLTGTDEHGQKVQEAADQKGVSPQAHADTTVLRFQELWRKLEITHDDFIRTTEKRHTIVVQKILQDLYDRGEIHRSDYDGWYCIPDERFFVDRDLREGKCPECGRSVERITESNYFFRMSRYQEWLIQYIQEHPQFIQPDFRRNETLGFLRKPLNDLCISRPKSRLAWGIELPFDNKFVTYVWFDALVNYISAIGYGSDSKTFETWWPASCQLVGKDILTTHTVYWPTMLKAMNLPLPETIFAHGWWLVEGTKMAKSLGNVVNPMDFADKYGVDPFRYFLMAEMVLGQDASFTEAAFLRRYNTDLANDLGNVLSRVLKLLVTSCGGRILEPGAPGPEELQLREMTESAATTMLNSITGMRLDQGLGATAAVLRETNRYLEKRQPWRLAKEPDPTALHTVLYSAAEVLRIVSGLLYAVMPEKMGQLRKALGIGEDRPDIKNLQVWGHLKPGTEVGNPVILFPRVNVDKAEPDGDKAAQLAKEPAEPGIPAGVTPIEYTDFEKVQLRTARILEAERIQGSDKLLRLQILVGEEKRQIVAGIALHYQPDSLIGRSIVVVANLKPAKIRGVESNGMLLAASVGSELRLVSIDGDLPAGARVK